MQSINFNSFTYKTISLMSMAVLFGFALTNNAHGASRVGVTAAVKGKVMIAPPIEASRKAVNGESVYFADTITSGTKSGLQLMLVDETTITLGENAELIIDDMVYDPGKDSKLVMRISSGAFRYISGQIAKLNRENIVIKTPLGDIGIRGTNLFGVKQDDGWFFGLLGPGPRNNTGDSPGGFVFESETGTREVRRAGFGFSINADKEMGEIIRIPNEIISEFQSSIQLSARPADASGGKVDEKSKPGVAGASRDSGQDGIATQMVAAAQGETLKTGSALGAMSSQQSQAATDIFSPISLSELYAYSGTANYSSIGIPLYKGSFAGANVSTREGILAASKQLTGSSVGSYDFSLTSNFSSRTVSGSFSNINANVESLGTTIINDTLIVNDALSNDIRTFSTTTNNANIYFDSNIGFTQSGTANPNVVQGLMITDTSWNDQLVGGSIISAQ